VARSVDVDAERELLEPLGYEEGTVSDRDAWIGLAADTGGGGASRCTLEGTCYAGEQVKLGYGA
jgi:hypothetical protein